MIRPSFSSFWNPTVLQREYHSIPSTEMEHYSNDNPTAWKKLPAEIADNRDYVDVPFTYKWNSDGWRCDEFDSECDYRFLIAGDSFVIGEGVPIENLWCTRLIKKLEEKSAQRMPYFGIGYVGANSKRILRNIIAFTNLWKTDRVLAMYPSCYRFTIIGALQRRTELLWLDTQAKFRVKGENFDSDLVFAGLNEETLMLNWIQDVLMAKMHCDLLKIPFNWTTWDMQLDINILPESLKECYINTFSFEDIHIETKNARDGYHPGEAYQQVTARELLKYYDPLF